MGRSIRIPWLSVFVLTLFSFPLLGGLNEWTTRGPEFPGAITALVTSPLDDATVYASGREGGVFKSVDGGGRWGRASHGLTDWSIRGLAIAPDAPQTLYALTYRNRLFKTEDGAAGWRELAMPNIGTKIAVIALEGGVVLLSTEGGHLVRSTDGGETWTTSMGPCGPATRFTRSADGDVACSGFTPALSEDRGATWQKIETPRRVSLIAFGPDGSVFVFSPEGTHKSVDGGKNFRKVAGLDTAVIKVNDLHVSRSGVVFAGADSGAFALRDEGWKPVEGAALHITAFADLNPASERIYAGTVDGVLTALETDSSWRKASDGLANVFINDVAISPQDPSLLFATGGGARFRSDSATSAWKRLRANVGSFVATSPASPNVVYSGDASIEKSTDAGETWTAIKVSAVSRLAVAQSDPSRLYAALEDQGMARSTDGGETWASIMNNMPWGYYGAIYGFDAYITVDPVDSSVVYVGQEAGLFRTTSGGDSWMPLSQSRAPIAVDPYDPTILYAPFPDSAFSFPRGLSRSNDRGVTWTRIGPVDEEFVDVAVDPSTPGVLYAATERRVYRSVDRGATWSVLGGDLEGPGIRDLEIDASGHYLVAAT
ncbi:MAG TPA: hypothetical protein VFV54_06430, partial [Thermoanaerobaculia bacterium]|nr:hypothetical protein [Thermoanaerobaculia bacterium]